MKPPRDAYTQGSDPPNRRNPAKLRPAGRLAGQSWLRDRSEIRLGILAPPSNLVRRWQSSFDDEAMSQP